MIPEFQNIKLTYEGQRARKSGLECSTSSYEGCPQISLRKDSWGPGKPGVTFHVWLDKRVEDRNKVRYNIHALKMREMKNHVITSRVFAEKFRKHFKSASDAWPNVSVEFGPQNLMEGWIAFHAQRFESDVLALMGRFEEISPIIDRLLAESASSR